MVKLFNFYKYIVAKCVVLFHNNFPFYIPIYFFHSNSKYICKTSWISNVSVPFNRTFRITKITLIILHCMVGDYFLKRAREALKQESLKIGSADSGSTHSRSIRGIWINHCNLINRFF